MSDHSQGAHYAGGMKPPAITLQHREIDRLNATHEVLETFDFVIASAQQISS